MYKLFFLFGVFVLFQGCSESSAEEFAKSYKDEFLNIAEFECEGISSEHYIQAMIDNQVYCRSADDIIKNQVHLVGDVIMDGPEMDEDNVQPVIEQKVIWFGLYEDFGGDNLIKVLLFSSKIYPPSTTALEIAEDVFVEGKRWPVAGDFNNQFGITVMYRYFDFRENLITSHYTKSLNGSQPAEAFVQIDKVDIRKDNEFTYFAVEISFAADLYMRDLQLLDDNLWAEVREGKMVAEFKVEN